MIFLKIAKLTGHKDMRKPLQRKILSQGACPTFLVPTGR